MRLVIDLDTGVKSKPKASKASTTEKPRTQSNTSGNWYITAMTMAMIAGMVVPQFSDVLKGVFAIRDASAPITATPTKYRLPVAIGVPVTSEYGWRIHPISGDRKFHAGIDFGAAQGQPIYAAAGGKVTFAGERGGYGNTIEIQHNGRESTLYGHASALLVSVGQQVVQGQMIGRVGSTGNSTGPHLHFEVHVNGKHTDPRPFLKQLANR